MRRTSSTVAIEYWVWLWGNLNSTSVEHYGFLKLPFGIRLVTFQLELRSKGLAFLVNEHGVKHTKYPNLYSNIYTPLMSFHQP